ncbi:MAG: AAA family ATPase [Deltaproteobacteria bacterium]|nr:AAA family ATPase [Deltaproteobacteria bacterium]
MYAHFYHLSENPFNLTPDPKFHYINESTREALASMLYGIKSRKGFLTLIGEAGTGKTTMLRRIVDEIEGETRIVFVFNPGVSFDELLEFICMELGIRAEAKGRLKLLERLNAYLLEQLTEGRNVVVIIDEAQTLEDAVLEELRLLSNLETSKEKILQIVLSGQPELEEKLRRPHLRQLRQRVGVRATLRAMRPDETRAYVETRLRSAGSEKAELFTGPALLRCWQASQGIPRVINVICDNAMMIAFAEGKDRISASLMNAAIRDLDGESQVQAMMRRVRDLLGGRRVGAGAAAAGVLVVAFALGRGWSGPGLWIGETSQRTAHESVREADRGGATGATEGAAARPAPVTESARQQLDASATSRREARRSERVARASRARDPVAPSRPSAAPVPAPVAASVAAPAAPTSGVAARELPVRALDPVQEPAPVAVAPPPAAAPVPTPPPVEVAAAAPAIRETFPSAAAVGVPRFEDLDPLTDEDAAVQESAPSGALPDVMTGSVRRAEEQARSAAARLYGEGAPEPVRALPPRGAGVAAASAAAVASRPAASAGAGAAEAGLRSVAEAEAMAAAALLPPPTSEPAAAVAESGGISTPPEALVPAATARGRTSASPGLAQGLESVASLSGGASKQPRASGRPPIGRQIHVGRGDTVWAIAMQYYGTVDSAVLTQIFRYNAGISDAHRLDLGSEVFLPFLSPEQMVAPAAGGGYQVLLAESTDRRVVDRAAAWASSALPGRALRTATRGKGTPVRTIYAVGFPSRDAAIESARYLLGRSSRSAGDTGTGHLVAAQSRG